MMTLDEMNAVVGTQESEDLMLGLDGVTLLSLGYYQVEVESIQSYYKQHFSEKMPRRLQKFIASGFQPTHRCTWTWALHHDYRVPGGAMLVRSNEQYTEIG